MSREPFHVACVALQAVASAGDVRKKEDAAAAVQAAVSAFGKLDILINAAAGNFLAAAEDLSSNGFRTGAWGPSDDPMLRYPLALPCKLRHAVPHLVRHRHAVHRLTAGIQLAVRYPQSVHQDRTRMQVYPPSDGTCCVTGGSFIWVCYTL